MILRISAPSAEIDAKPYELVERELVLLELADGKGGTIDRKGRHDDVYARTVGEAGIADRRGFVYATSDLTDDSLTDGEELGVVAEADIRLLDLAGDLDEDPVAAIHHDIGDVVARQKRLERAVSKDVVADVFEQFALLGFRHRHLLGDDDLSDGVADLPSRPIGIHFRQLRYVDDFDQGAKYLLLDVIVFVGLVSLGLTARPLRRRGASALTFSGSRGGNRCASTTSGRTTGRSSTPPSDPFFLPNIGLFF